MNFHASENWANELHKTRKDNSSSTISEEQIQFEKESHVEVTIADEVQQDLPTRYV